MAIRTLEELLNSLVSKVDRLERRLNRRSGPSGISGEMKMWTGETAPSGWLLAQGQVLATADYPALFAVLGARYGGNGSTTFALPDLRGRAVVGHDAGQSEFDQIGKKGGAKTHTLSVGEMPSHAHGWNRSSSGSTTEKSFDVPLHHRTTGNGGLAAIGTALSGDIVSYYTMANAGGGGAHNNLQPYIALNFIIKT
ncbi:tail collar domain protein [Microbacterium phage MO526]|uniref:Tail collar domain protein n=1 Tax=Microbacterium phage MO526 TaxID=3108092 RepID=A0ABZ1A0Z7_9CAUD|nr:tail collar domain protein [Microbacterium phage MO526]